MFNKFKANMIEIQSFNFSRSCKAILSNFELFFDFYFRCYTPVESLLLETIIVLNHM